MAMKIRCNDQIIVLTGKDKGKQTKIKKILKNGKVILEGVNLVKKHQKPVPSQNKPGGIIEKEAPIDFSNVAIFNEDTGKPDKIGFKYENGKKVRFFKSSGKAISNINKS
ncbi:50S ribosomal protein L24 [Candidatus Williamhamiltonella defendens]|uniref:50S ribosomal protein L24 n=1 Tax=Candidatus Williamhamiltonella defendens TaxID=138072 RepID=UPI00130E4562|nr:50S ribosomal protein L24 [Candidatus Hamiltonella defensa]